MLNKGMRRKFTVLGVLISTLLVGGIALAAWTSTGTGSGSAIAGTSVNSAITSASAAIDLYPGASKPLTVTINNPNAYPVIVTKIFPGASNLAGVSCVTATVTTAAVGDGITALTPTSGGANPIPGTTGTRTYTVTATMIAAAADACKGLTFTIPVTATVQSNA